MLKFQEIFKFTRGHSELILILTTVLIFGLLVYFYGVSPKGIYNEGEVIINNRHGFKVSLADTPLKRAKGLSGIKSLSATEGMLFLFDKPAIQYFWMKDMLIPIDIIWISNGRVVGFVENAQPEPDVPTYKLKKYPSPETVDYVLEAKAGTVRRISLQVGDPVSIRL